MSTRPIAIYGAAGHTGRLVAKALHARGHQIVLGARDGVALAELARQLPGATTMAFALDDRLSLAAFVTGADLVINCAGPFAATAPVIVRAALATGAHYVDVTGEPPVVAGLDNDFGAEAMARGLAIVPATGFFGALPDLLATAVASPWPHVERVTIAYALDNWRMTPGSRAAGAGLVGRRHVFAGGRLEIESGAPTMTTWRFPPDGAERAMVAGYPAPEVVTLGGGFASQDVTILMTLSTVAEIRNGAAGAEASEAERAGSRFTLMTEVTREGQTHSGWLAGGDIYGITALIVTEVVERLLSPAVAAEGLVRPSQILDARAVLARLPGLEVELPQADLVG